MPENSFETTCLLSYYRSEDIYQDIVAIKQRLSMMHADVLMLLYHFGKYCQHAILEIGPYIGGSSIALAKGGMYSSYPKRIVSIDLGVSCDIPTISSNNVLEDLKKNLRDFGVNHLVDVVEGNSRDPQIVKKVQKLIQVGQVGLFIMDSDGEIGGDLNAYLELLRDDCLLVIDDYLSPGNPEKGDLTKRAVDLLMKEGFMECFGVFGWGTWIGKRTGANLPKWND